MISDYYRGAFEKIAPEKQEKILTMAIEEFASKGYESANINIIAEKAGISVGSLYKYFGSKEALYLAIIHRGVETIKSVLRDIMAGDEDLFSRIERIIRTVQSFSKSDVHLTRLYNGMATESRSDLVRKVVTEMEGITAGLYTSFVKEAQESGIVRKDADPALFAFFLDNLFMSLQFSYSCEYYRERLKIYAGAGIFENDELVVSELMKFLKAAFTAGAAS